jgi:hypothetical protein
VTMIEFDILAIFIYRVFALVRCILEFVDVVIEERTSQFKYT